MREGTRKEKIRDGKNKGGGKAEPVRKKEAQKDKGKTSSKETREKKRIKRFGKREAENQEIKRAKTCM